MKADGGFGDSGMGPYGYGGSGGGYGFSGGFGGGDGWWRRWKARRKAKGIRLLALDVDGVLSDGHLDYYSARGDSKSGGGFGSGGGGASSGGSGDGDGDAVKRFFTADGLGIKLLQQGGIEAAIITGRRSAAVERRARELGIRQVMQGREDKLAALKELLAGRNIPLEQAAYMGDDLPDLAAIQACGLGMVPADGDPYVAGFSDWRSFRPGGRGATREACEFILEAQGKLKAARADYLE